MIGFDGLEGVSRDLAARLHAIDAANDKATAAVRERLTSDETVKLRAMEDWDRMVYAWAGATDMEFGATLRESEEEPAGDGRTISRKYEFTVERSPLPGLVVLRVVERVESESFYAFVADIFGANWVDELDLEPGEALMMESTYTTEADPETLIPSSYRKVTARCCVSCSPASRTTNRSR